MTRSLLASTRGLALLSAVACGACGARSCGKGAHPPASTAAPSTQSEASNARDPQQGSGPATPAPAVPAIESGALQALLDRWVKAQNEAAFESYESLYAAKFFGVKRVGEREIQFGRAGWLRDRRRMFQKPIQVEARDPEFSTNDGYAQVRFTQHWTSGGFEDVGPKQLLVVREAGELRIAQEELLHSDVIARATAARGGGAFDFHFVVRLESGSYLVLSEASVPSALGAYSLEHGARDPMMVPVSRSLDESALDAATRAWKQRSVRLEGGCLAKVADFRVLSRVVPHFGEVQLWKGEQPNEPARVAWTDEQIAKAAFDAQTASVVARLDDPGTCEDARFARLGGAPEPIVAELVTDAALVQRARIAFAQLPSVRELQQSYRKEVPDAKGQWWEPSVETAIYRHPRSGQTLVSIKADNGGVCGEFSASEWALFELRGGALHRLEPHWVPVAIDRVFDLDGDGRLELLVRGDFGTERELFNPDGGRPALELTYVYRDCPC